MKTTSIENAFYAAANGLKFSRRIMRVGIKFGFNAQTAKICGFDDVEVRNATRRIGFKEGFLFNSINIAGEGFDHAFDSNGKFFAVYTGY